MKTKIAALLLLSLGFAHSAFAGALTLETANAQKIEPDNTTSDFYNVARFPFVESGTAMDLFSSEFFGDAETGFWVKISFDGNPQPILTSAFLKASNKYLLWDAAALATFNEGIYDSIILKNEGANGIFNTGNGNFHNIGHAGLNGTLGKVVVDQQNHNVPDASSTVALLGLGMIGLFVAARRRASK